MNFLEQANEIKEKIIQATDDLSTKIYRAGRIAKEKYEDTTKGKTAANTEQIKRDEYNQKMLNQFLGGESPDFMEEGLQRDSARDNMDIIDTEFHEPTKVLNAQEEIESFLYDLDNANFADVEENKKKNKNEVEPYSAEQVNKGQKLLNEFENNGFGFNEVRDAVKNKGINLNNNMLVERYGQLNAIIRAFSGDRTALSSIDTKQFSNVNKRFINLLKNYMGGNISKEETGKKLFGEVCGIDSNKMTPDISQNKLASLCSISLLGQNVSEDLIESNEGKLESIIEIVKRGDAVNIQEMIIKDSIAEIFDKTRKEGDQVKDFDIAREGGTIHTLYFENEGNGAVSVYHDSASGSSLVAKQDEQGNYVRDDMEANLMNAFKRDKGVRQELDGTARTDLQKEIDKFRTDTTREAAAHKLSDAELANIKLEEEQAIAQHNLRINNFQ